MAHIKRHAGWRSEGGMPAAGAVRQTRKTPETGMQEFVYRDNPAVQMEESKKLSKKAKSMAPAIGSAGNKSGWGK